MSAIAVQPEIPPPSSSGKKSDHLDYIYGMRAILAIWVMLVHDIPGVWVIDLPPWIHWVNLVMLGHPAVTSFIVISGFCLMLPVAKEGAIRGGIIGFYARRWKRILPAYYASIGLALFADKQADRMRPLSGYWHSMRDHLKLIQDFGVLQICNAPTWTIAVEWHIYLFFPLFVYLMLKIGPQIAIYVTIIAYMLQVRFGTDFMALQYYGLFTVGMAAALLGQNSKVVRIVSETKILKYLRSSHILVAAFLISAWYINHMTASGYNQINEYYDLIVAIITAAALIIIRHSVNLNRVFTAKWLVAIGIRSYSLYLIHWPIYVLMLAWLPKNSPFWINPTTVGIPLTLIGACIWYEVFEKPFIRTKVRSS